MSDLNVDSNWRYFEASRNELINYCESCPDVPYLSLVVRADPRSKMSVMRIKFTSFTKDQLEEGDETPSWTYMVYRVLDEAGQDRVGRRVIYCSDRMPGGYDKYVRCWDARESKHKAWLNGIKSGDTIHVMPRAYFKNWNLYVAKARVEIWAEFLPVHNDPTLESKLSLNTSNDFSGYQKLDKDSKTIRIARLSPRMKSDEPILLGMCETSLTNNDHIPYTAISYCWAEERDFRKILVQSDQKTQPPTEILVYNNIFNILSWMRHENKAQYIWIDILSINQHDTDEKNIQVALMGQIFASATSVLVWLGESDEGSTRDFETCHEVWQKYVTDHSDLTIHKDLDGWYNEHSMFRLPWFNRVWVLQEAWSTPVHFWKPEVKSRGRIRVVCGRHELPFECVMQANQCLNSKFYNVYEKPLMPGLWSAVFEVSRKPCDLSIASTRLDILKVLLGGLDMKASDSRDKIFALLVFGDESWNISKLPDSIRPDYAKKAVQVYVDFTRWWIQYHSSLKILSAVHTLQGRTWLNNYGQKSGDTALKSNDVPSWTLWTDGQSEWSHGTLALDDEGMTFAASAGRSINLDILPTTHNCDGLHSLHLQGIMIGQITSIDYYSYFQQQAPEMDRVYEQIFDIGAKRMIWRNSRKGFEKINPFEESIQTRAWKHWHEHWPQMQEQYGETKPWLPCSGKCMFTTDKGNVGLCPSGARVGDELVILYGGNVPYIIRGTESSRSEYKIVGECYLSRMMHGEALEATNTDQDRVFCLV